MLEIGIVAGQNAGFELPAPSSLPRTLVRVAFDRKTLRAANVTMALLLAVSLWAAAMAVVHHAWWDLSGIASCAGTLIVGYAVTLGQREVCARIFSVHIDSSLNDVCTAYGTGLLIASLTMLSAQSCAGQIPLLAPALLCGATLLHGVCLALCVRLQVRLQP